MSAFGVGCFYFAERLTDSRRFSPKHYVKQLRECLQSMDAIGDIRLSDVNLPEDVSGPTQPTGDVTVDRCLPGLSRANFRYSFELHVPRRLHASLMGRKEGDDAGTDKFLVHTRYTSFGPVSFVECPPNGVVDAPLPSSAVMIVSKYLQRQVNTREQALCLNVVEPSPFRADFFIKADIAGPGSDCKFDSTCEPLLGNDRVTLVGQCADQKDLEPLKAELFSTLDRELSFFYKLMRERSAERDDWRLIRDGLQLIIDQRPEPSLLNPIRGFIENRDRIRQLTHRLLAFRATSADAGAQREEIYRRVYRHGGPQTFLKRYIDQEFADLYEYPTSDILEMLKFEEERSKHALHQYIVLLATAFGALFGAALTKALS